MRIFTFCLLFLSLYGFSQKKLHKSALIIGNSSYANQPLINPVNDAEDLATQLEVLGFKVFTLTNQTRTEMREAIIEYGDYVKSNPGISLFYYAGHGIQSSGINYMIPINANIQREWEIQDECVKVDVVLRMLQSYQNPANIIILDACRNNPYARAFRSEERGLANEQYDFTGSIIAYATAPGMTASDGKGRNGLYTQELIKTLKIPGLSIEEVFKRVRVSVWEHSNQQQIPWENSSLMGNYYFNSEGTEVSRPISTPAVQPDSLPSVSSFDFTQPLPQRSRAHIASDHTNALSSAFEIMHSNDERIDLTLLDGFKKFEVNPFGDGNSIDLRIGEGFEYLDSSFLVMDKVQFGRGSDKLLKDAIPPLENFAQFVVENPGYSVIIDGHTDFVGNAKANMALSQARVNTISDFLKKRGINKNRMTLNAYGGSRPLNLARTQEAKLENRRVEFRLIKKSRNLLIYVDNSEESSPEKIKKLLTNDYGYELVEGKDIYSTDFIAELNSLKALEFSDSDRLIIYLKGSTKKEGSTELVGFKNSDFSDPITCLKLDEIKDRVNQIPARSIILITEFEAVN